MDTYENDSSRYRDCWKVIWGCAENLTYPEFYQAWHQSPTPHPEIADFQPSGDITTQNQLERQFTDIYTQLQQLKPTTSVYPLAIDATSLSFAKNDEDYAEGLCNNLYIALSRTPIPECRSFLTLEREIKNITASLSKTKLALILINADQVLSSSEFIEFCKILSKNCVIIFLTNTPLNPPLQSFPPEQENLLNIIQTWLEEN